MRRALRVAGRSAERVEVWSGGALSESAEDQDAAWAAHCRRFFSFILCFRDLSRCLYDLVLFFENKRLLKTDSLRWFSKTHELSPERERERASERRRILFQAADDLVLVRLALAPEQTGEDAACAVRRRARGAVSLRALQTVHRRVARR